MAEKCPLPGGLGSHPGPWVATPRKTKDTKRLRWVMAAVITEMCQHSSGQKWVAGLSYRVISMTNLPKWQVEGPLRITEIA